MAISVCTLHLTCSAQRPPFSSKVDSSKALPFSFKPFIRELQNIPISLHVSKIIKDASARIFDAVVEQVFEFVYQPLLPGQGNFTPVEEIEEAITVTSMEGDIPDDFPQGVYLRNGANPLFGGLKSAVSVFGRSSEVWVEGEGMLHALYFRKKSHGSWTKTYKNKFLETQSFLLEKERNKPCLLPAVEGNRLAILLSLLLNRLRFGSANKLYSNTNVFEHGGKVFSVAENYVPQEIDILTLATLGDWDLNGTWTRPFTSHPKRAPGSGELVTMGIDAQKPYFELGVVSVDGKKLIHKVDLKFDRSIISHDIGVTQRYNVILDFPLILDTNRLMRGGALIKYEKDQFARIGVMPRYGNADSVRWFEVEPCCAFHIINCFEDENEVVVMACRAPESIIPGPELGQDKFEWFARGLKKVNPFNEINEDCQEGKLFSRGYEWRLNMETGEVKGGYLTGTQLAVDFPMINEKYTGLKNKYAYAQVVDSDASSNAGLPKYGGLAKLYVEEGKLESSSGEQKPEEFVKIEYHMFPSNTFCTGATFVTKKGALEEDDGWVITFVHNEDTNTSHVYIVDAKQFSQVPVTKIALPSRVPYGFHGTFISTE